ncbi:hypothetical protein VNI00_019070 [Paramarasmius palmivorus]|uniref:Uncharacterized protein n=1 Tax=Paramarasmius palmivorus TaxID=297713 RepID=A0AAW0AR11_9AGAR
MAPLRLAWKYWWFRSCALAWSKDNLLLKCRGASLKLSELLANQSNPDYAAIRQPLHWYRTNSEDVWWVLAPRALFQKSILANSPGASVCPIRNVKFSRTSLDMRLLVNIRLCHRSTQKIGDKTSTRSGTGSSLGTYGNFESHCPCYVQMVSTPAQRAWLLAKGFES